MKPGDVVELDLPVTQDNIPHSGRAKVLAFFASNFVIVELNYTLPRVNRRNITVYRSQIKGTPEWDALQETE